MPLLPMEALSLDKYEIEKLRSLPYAQWTKKKANTKKRGVTIYKPKKAYPGYNLYTNDKDRAFLRDMKGKIVHKWNFEGYTWCEHVKVIPDGSIMAVCIDQGLVHSSWESNIIWKWEKRVHHDVDILANGQIMVPCTIGEIPYKGHMVAFDEIAFLNKDGNLDKTWSTLKNLQRLQPLHLPTHFDDPDITPVDDNMGYYHLNSVQELPENPLGKKDKRFRAGNILICLRNVDLILILDRNTFDVAWSWGPGELEYPHNPRMLPNGHITIFDNGVRRKYSRVIEINPQTKKIVWEYKGRPPKKFYSMYRGTSQRLPNGNTLICESEKGRAFEVTPEGEVVFEFWNPIFNKKKRRKRIYSFQRIPLDFFTKPIK